LPKLASFVSGVDSIFRHLRFFSEGGAAVNFALSTPAVVVLVCTAIAAVTDWHSFTIRNVITLPLILSGILYHALVNDSAGFFDSVGAVCLMAAILFVPYVLGGMGAGDLKLMAGVGAWLGIRQTFYVLIASSLAAGVYALVLVVQRRELKRTLLNFQVMYYKFRSLGAHLGPDERIETIVGGDDRRRRAIPFGVMVALGVIIVLVWTSHA
jgi:prepilin peptidase CpaA